MRRRTKVVAGLGAIVLAGTGLFCVPTVWGKPWSIEHFYLRTFATFALDHPLLLTGMGFLEAKGITFHSDDLDDFSLEGLRGEHARLRRNLDTLHSYDRAALEDPLSYDVLEWFMDDRVRGIEFAFHNYPVNQMSGFQSALPDFMIQMHRLEDAEGARDYVARLSKFGVAFDQMIEGIEYREGRGVVPPRFVMTQVLEEMREFVAPEPREHVLYTHLAEKTEALGDLSPGERESLLDAAARELEETVYPAYGRMIDHYAALEPTASTEDGVWKLPDGDAYYAWRLRSNTTTELSPQEVHELGLREVERLQAEMKGILRAEGYDPADFGKTMQALNREPRFLYPDTDAGREQILADYQSIIDEIDANMGSVFTLRPDARVEVERVPVFKQAKAPGAYYQGAPLDRSQPGVFFANLRSVEEIPKFGMRTLAYHEAVPGHHYQISIQQELTGVPFFRKMIPFAAYSEGWALYAEQVAAESGFQDDPYDRLGYLTADLFRANRLVVDTGIHAMRWTREQAIAYMLANTGMPETDVVAEIERYIVNPGQACAYKIGKLKMLELRERAREALGERFDIREFHALVLERGAIPLSLLDGVVDEWIAEKAG